MGPGIIMLHTIWNTSLCRAHIYQMSLKLLNQCFNRGQHPMRHQRFTKYLSSLPGRCVEEFKTTKFKSYTFPSGEAAEQ